MQSIEFCNFRVLGHATLPLGCFNLLIGPNGSGKSTAIEGLLMATSANNSAHRSTVVSIECEKMPVTIVCNFLSDDLGSFSRQLTWDPGAAVCKSEFSGGANYHELSQELWPPSAAPIVSVYSLEASHIAQSVALVPGAQISREGGNLAAVLDQIRDLDPDRFDSLNAELGRMLPEFDQILFETPSQGTRSFLLRTRFGRHRIPAHNLSQGTLFALALLTIAYLPNPPSIVYLEEPDRGIHPRLLRDIRDALYRLSYPESYGEHREPVQVIATTHSPYMLDLYREHPEEVVIAEKGPEGATFGRLSDRSDLDEILGDAHLGDVWYSGILGGVPATR